MLEWILKVCPEDPRPQIKRDKRFTSGNIQMCETDFRDLSKEIRDKGAPRSSE